MLRSATVHPEPRQDRTARPSGVDGALSLELPATYAAPGMARRMIVDGLGLTQAAAADVGLLISEAVTNSVLHAGLEPGEPIEVMAVKAGRRVTVEVCDHGRGTRAPSATPTHRSGFGLRIVNELAESWELLDEQPTRLVFRVLV